MQYTRQHRRKEFNCLHRPPVQPVATLNPGWETEWRAEWEREWESQWGLEPGTRVNQNQSESHTGNLSYVDWEPEWDLEPRWEAVWTLVSQRENQRTKQGTKPGTSVRARVGYFSWSSIVSIYPSIHLSGIRVKTRVEMFALIVSKFGNPAHRHHWKHTVYIWRSFVGTRLAVLCFNKATVSCFSLRAACQSMSSSSQQSESLWLSNNNAKKTTTQGPLLLGSGWIVLGILYEKAFCKEGLAAAAAACSLTQTSRKNFFYLGKKSPKLSWQTDKNWLVTAMMNGCNTRLHFNRWTSVVRQYLVVVPVVGPKKAAIGGNYPFYRFNVIKYHNKYCNNC